MNAAVLFDDSLLRPSGTAQAAILRSGVLQSSGRVMLVRAGLYLLSLVDSNGRKDIIEQTFFGDAWRRIDTARLNHVLRNSSVYVWLISNITRAIAEDLHNALAVTQAYLGIHAVDYFSNKAHLAMYRLRLPLLVRLDGFTCYVFYRAFDPESKNHELFKDIAALGFSEVLWEDIGIRDSLFDDFESPDHFRRLEALRTQLTLSLSGGADAADEFLVLLEDLNPRLAATLGTAAEAFLKAASEEDVAAAGISARRYLEQLADSVFPPRPELINGRSVTKDKWRNRLWAYAERQLSSGSVQPPVLEELGVEIDRLTSAACAAVHDDHPSRAQIGVGIADLARLTVALLGLAPERHRGAYTPYAPNLLRFLRKNRSADDTSA